MSESKLDEATRLIESAENSLKTSFFKRKPDRDQAIEYYTKAAVIFKNARKFHESADLYQKVAELHHQLGSLFHSAKNYELAALMHKELKQFGKMAELVAKAADLFLTAGTPDSASYLLDRTAKSLEEPLPCSAAEFYERSAKACETEDKFHEAADHCNSAARVWVRLRQFDNAERCLRLYLDFICQANPSSVASTIGGLSDVSAVPKLCARVFLVLVVIKLHLEDEVAAAKVYSEALTNWRLAETDESFVIKRLIGAYEDGDSAELTNIVKSSSFRNLDLDFARLARELKVTPSAQPQEHDDSSITPAVDNAGPTQHYSEASYLAEHESAEEDIC